MEERVYQGQTYRRNGPGEPWQRVGGGSGNPVAGVVPSNPVLVQKQQEEADRRNRAEQRAIEAAERSANAAARSAQNIPSGYQPAPGGGLMPVPGGPADPAAKPNARLGRAMRVGDADKLDQQIGSYAALKEAALGFQDDYGGNTIGGEVENWAQGLFNTGTPGQRDWWSNFRAADNLIRNQLFGASLTDGEKRAYEQTTVTPRMSPAEIRKNLTRRVEIARKGLERRTDRLRAAGFNEEEIMASVGEYAPDFGADLPVTQSGPAFGGKREDAIPGAQTSFLNPIGGTRIDQGPDPALGPGQKFAYDDGGKPIGILNSDGSWAGGYSQIDGTIPDEAAAASAEQKAADAAARDNAMGGVDAYGRNFANAWTLGGADKVSAAANAILPVDALFGGDVKSVWGGNSLGDAYRANLGVQERTNGADRRSNPLPSFAGDVSGSLAGMVTANRLLGGLGAGGMVARTGGAAGDVAYGTARGGVENGPEGALIGATAALAGNAAGRYVLAPAARAVADTRAGRGLIDAARRGGNAVGNARRGLFGRPAIPPRPANIPPPLPRGERSAMARLPADAEDQLNEASRMGLPMALADLSPELQMLTGSAVRKSTAARDMAENTLRPRQLGQADRAQEQIARNFGPVNNPNEISDQLLQQGRQNAAPLYDAFRAQPARTSDELTAMLGTPAGTRALANARNIAANEGRDPNALGFDLDQQGNVILRNDPSPETLDLVKRGFDDVINDYRDPTSGRLNLNDQGRAIEGLRQRFVGEVDRLYPNYADARRAYAGPAGEREALQTGRDMANAQPRDILPRMQGYTPGQQEQFRLGQRVAMSDAVNGARMTTNPYERVYGSPTAQARAATVFGAGPAANFGRAHQLEGNMARTAQEALGGSPTAARLAADEAFDGMVGDAVEAGTSVLTGGGGMGGLVQRASRGVRDNIRLRGGEQRGAELAPLLLNTDPAAMAALIARMRQASTLRNNYVQRTRQAGGIFGASLGTGATLSGQ